MYITNYDYNGQSGEYYNEAYTYDKTWNESSWVGSDGLDGGDEQLPTGINTNNYFIQKYGADFVEYRGMGWMNDRWRRPNLRRNGGISIGITASAGSSGSSPMEYTNGGHPRYLYLGNRLVSVCGHCIPYVGLPTGQAVFMGADGATLAYDIAYWNDETGGRQGTKKATWIGWIDSSGQTGTTAPHGEGRGRQGILDNQSGGGWNTASLLWGGGGGGIGSAAGGSGGDGVVFMLETDPEDDGIPPLKECVVFDGGVGASLEFSGMALTGLGVMMPMHYMGTISGRTTIDGVDVGMAGDMSIAYGGNLSGDNAIIWSGDSGTSMWINAGERHGWKPLSQAWAGAWHPVIVDRLHGLFPSYGYSLLTLDPEDLSIEPEVLNTQGGSVGYTAGVTTGIVLGNRILNNVLRAEVVATGPYPDSPLQNVISATASIVYTDFGEGAVPPYMGDTQLYTNDGISPYGNGQTVQIPYDAAYSSLTLKPLANINSGTYPALFNATFVGQDGTIIGGDGSHTAQQVYDEMVPLIGQTGEMIVNYYNDIGVQETKDIWYVEGFTSGTGGWTYDADRSYVLFDIDSSSTAVQRGYTYDNTYSAYFTNPTNIIGVADTYGITLDGASADDKGRTFSVLLDIDSRWSMNDQLGGTQTNKYSIDIPEFLYWPATIYTSRPWFDQVLNIDGGSTLDYDTAFAAETGIPNDRHKFMVWMPNTGAMWTTPDGTQDASYIPGTTTEYEYKVFNGVDNDGNITDAGATGLVKQMFDAFDIRINANGWGKSGDIGVLDLEIPAVWSSLVKDWWWQYRGETYDSVGGVSADGTVVSPIGKNYGFTGAFPESEWVNTWFPIVIDANKRFARGFRKRYNFSKIALYGPGGGFQGWWEGMSQNPPAGTTQTHDQWLQFTHKRAIQSWVDAGLFEESEGNCGDNIDYIMALAKNDAPDANRPWSFPYGTGTAGFERVVQQVAEAYRPYKDKTILLINNYYSFTSGCTLNSQWDKAYFNGVGGTTLGITYPPVDAIGSATAASFGFPIKLQGERDALMPYYMRHFKGFDICDFSGTDWYKWAQQEGGSLSDSDKMRYRLFGYTGDFGTDDVYNFLFKRFGTKWYSEVYEATKTQR